MVLQTALVWAPLPSEPSVLVLRIFSWTLPAPNPATHLDLSLKPQTVMLLASLSHIPKATDLIHIVIYCSEHHSLVIWNIKVLFLLMLMDWSGAQWETHWELPRIVKEDWTTHLGKYQSQNLWYCFCWLQACNFPITIKSKTSKSN